MSLYFLENCVWKKNKTKKDQRNASSNEFISKCSPTPQCRHEQCSFYFYCWEKRFKCQWCSPFSLTNRMIFFSIPLLTIFLKFNIYIWQLDWSAIHFKYFKNFDFFCYSSQLQSGIFARNLIHSHRKPLIWEIKMNKKYAK